MHTNSYSLSWIPLHHKMIEVDPFAKFSPIEQVYYLYLMKEFNGKDDFYKADIEFQAALNCSLRSIRNARRKFEELGWIDCKKGRQVNGQNLATEYKKVRFAEPEKNEKGNTSYFIAFDKYALEVLLHHLRQGIFEHKDIVVYSILWYWYGSKKFLEGNKDYHKSLLNQPLDIFECYGDNTKVYISKNHLSRLTGLSINQVVKSINRLYSNFNFSGGASLFEFNDDYHQLSFRSWATFSNPAKDDKNSRNADKYIYEIKQRAEKLRRKREIKKKSKDDKVVNFSD